MLCLDVDAVSEVLMPTGAGEKLFRFSDLRALRIHW